MRLSRLREPSGRALSRDRSLLSPSRRQQSLPDVYKRQVVGIAVGGALELVSAIILLPVRLVRAI